LQIFLQNSFRGLIRTSSTGARNVCMYKDSICNTSYDLWNVIISFRTLSANRHVDLWQNSHPPRRSAVHRSQWSSTAWTGQQKYYCDYYQASRCLPSVGYAMQFAVDLPDLIVEARAQSSKFGGFATTTATGSSVTLFHIALPTRLLELWTMHSALHIIDNTGTKFKGNITPPNRISEAHLHQKPNAVATNMYFSNIHAELSWKCIFLLRWPVMFCYKLNKKELCLGSS
jgi:hypothetical protein